jgi:formylglycine-generating enzyme required for sulfatase activity
MVTLKQLLRRTHTNYLDLLEREAKYGINKPLELINQIRDHEKAIRLIEAALETELTEAGLRQLKVELRPLLVASNVEEINLDDVKLETPPLPFEPETILIPAGPFLMGSPPEENIPDEETPQHKLTLPAYRIGKTPVTNAEYAEFIKRDLQQPVPKKAGWFLREPPADKLDHPVVGVSWYDARAYCRWLSQETGRTYRLPTEAEWEKAARGKKGLLYPWGNDWDADNANQGGHDTTHVRAHALGISPYRCYDMVGNVQQWTSTLWGSNVRENAFPYPYQAHDGREDLEADQHLHRVYRIHRGGSFRDDPSRLRCSARGYSDPDSKLRWRGFRVVLEV